MSDLVGNPNCWFSHAQAHIIVEVKALTEAIEKQNGQPTDLKQYVHESAANVVFTSIIGKPDQMHSLRQIIINLMEAEGRLLPKMGALLNCLPFLKYMPKDPLYVRTLQNEYQKFEMLLQESVVEPILRNPPSEATTFVDMYIEKVKEREKMDNETVFTIESSTSRYPGCRFSHYTRRHFMGNFVPYTLSRHTRTLAAVCG